MFVLIVAIITLICDAAELITNATSGEPSWFQFIMTSLHFLLNTVAMVVFLSYYRVLKSGGTGRERMRADDSKPADDASVEEGTNPFPPPNSATEDTPLMS